MLVPAKRKWQWYECPRSWQSVKSNASRWISRWRPTVSMYGFRILYARDLRRIMTLRDVWNTERALLRYEGKHCVIFTFGEKPWRNRRVSIAVLVHHSSLFLAQPIVRIGVLLSACFLVAARRLLCLPKSSATYFEISKTIVNWHGCSEQWI